MTLQSVDHKIARTVSRIQPYKAEDTAAYALTHKLYLGESLGRVQVTLCPSDDSDLCMLSNLKMCSRRLQPCEYTV